MSTSPLYLVAGAAVLIAWLWADEIPSTLELVGGLVVVLGVVTVLQGRRAIMTWLYRRRRP